MTFCELSHNGAADSLRDKKMYIFSPWGVMKYSLSSFLVLFCELGWGHLCNCNKFVDGITSSLHVPYGTSSVYFLCQVIQFPVHGISCTYWKPLHLKLYHCSQHQHTETCIQHQLLLVTHCWMYLCSYSSNCHYLLVLAWQCASHPGLLHSEGSSTVCKSFHNISALLLLLMVTEKKRKLC